MKKIFLTFFLLPIALWSQNYADKEHYLIDSLNLEELTSADQFLLDSCLGIYHQSKVDTIKINALNGICDNLVHDVWGEYQFIQYKLIQEALQKEITSKEKGAIQYYEGGALNNLGLYYEYQKGNSSKALDYYLKALKVYEELENKNGEAMMLNRIGTIYTYQDNAEKGFEYYLKSLKIYEALKDKREMANPLNCIGLYYENKGDHPQALDYFQESLKIDIESGNKQGIAMSHSNIGRTYVSKKEYDKSLISFIKGLKVFEEMGDQTGISLILNNIGRVYIIQGDDKSAYVNAKRSYDIAIKIGFPSRISGSSLLLSEIYEMQNKPADALEMYKLYTSTKDSVTNENTKTDAVRQQSKYEYNKQKAVDDAVYDKQLAVEQEAKEKQQIIIYAIGFGIALLAIFLFFVANRLQVTRKQKVIIEDAHEELSEKNKEILDSITYAKRIQTAILPPDKLVKEYLEDSFILYKPKDIVAGDFYWMKTVGNNNDTILFAAADCTGHGVPGAMVSVVCSNALNRSIKEYGLTDPAEILDRTREIVIEEFSASNVVLDDRLDYVKDGMDIALCALQGNKLKYAGANNPLWIIRNGEVLITKANKQPIGHFRSSEPFTSHSFELQEGDSIYIFSDGYVDQFGGERGKKFMAKALRKLLLSIQDKPMEEQRIAVDKAFESWRGDIEQVDDVCLIGVRI
ncbi:MAG: tetratricopeptide repeat protein [Flavobacteriales bacterium]|nr:tetratricopeptide repeat protein [Flavobacteriales bacterium]